MSLLSDAAALREAIASVAKSATEDTMRDCLRVRKAIVVTAPQNGVCGVHFVGDDTVLNLPYSSAVASVSAGDVVWVAVLGSSMRNAIVWEDAAFSIPNGTDGVTFIPSVSSAGVISWTNNGGLPNPASVDLAAAVIAALPSAVGVTF